MSEDAIIRSWCAHGGSWLGTLWTSLWCFLVFAVLWLLALPLLLAPPLNFALHPLLWGCVTYRVMAYDTLSEDAITEERRIILHRHCRHRTHAAVAGRRAVLVFLSAACVPVDLALCACIRLQQTLVSILLPGSAEWLSGLCRIRRGAAHN